MFCASYVYLFNLRWTGFTSPQPIVGRVYPSTLAFYPSKGRMDGSLDEAVDITPSDSVRNLGVIFDSDFSFHKHVSNICKSCFYHIRDLRRIRRHIPLSTAKTISNALISSRLDYCNSLLNNIAKQDLSKRQRVQNCLARVELRAPRFSPSLPLLKQLHWLPVNYRIQFKLSTLTYRALALNQPPYLASLLHFSNIPIQLRSSTSQQLSIPRTKLNLGKRAFSVAAPIIWNELPTTLKSCENLVS